MSWHINPGRRSASDIKRRLTSLPAHSLAANRLLSLPPAAREMACLATRGLEAGAYAVAAQGRGPASRHTCTSWKGLCPVGPSGPKLIELTQRLNCEK